MGTNHGAIENDALHVGVLGKMLVHGRPNPALFPTGESFVDTVPLAISFRKLSPLRTAAQHPVDAFHKLTTRFLATCIHIRMRFQKSVYLLPPLCGNLVCRHAIIFAFFAPLSKCQRNLVHTLVEYLRNLGR